MLAKRSLWSTLARLKSEVARIILWWVLATFFFKFLEKKGGRCSVTLMELELFKKNSKAMF
jgi:hypothetical protein